MPKQSFFGQDRSPHQTSMLFSSIITLICWIIFCVLSLVIKFKPKTPQYKEVQIVLSSTPVVEESASTEKSAVPEALEGPQAEETAEVEQKAVAEPVEAPAPTPAPAKKTTSASSSTTTKTQTPKTTAPATTPKATDPSKKVNFDDYQYATDYSEFDFNNVSTSSSKGSFDWSQFDDASSEPEPKVSQQVKTVTTQSSVGGSAASTTTQTNQSQTSTQSKASNSTSQSASSATTSALSNIKNTQYSVSTGNSLKSITDAKTSKTSDGRLNMEMSDGSTRVLINPVPPVIKLSEAAAALIDSTRTVTIEFQVLSSGNVPRNQVKITPESLLPEAVRTEIYDQLSRWQFEASSSSARATFEYTIRKQ